MSAFEIGAQVCARWKTAAGETREINGKVVGTSQNGGLGYVREGGVIHVVFPDEIVASYVPQEGQEVTS